MHAPTEPRWRGLARRGGVLRAGLVLVLVIVGVPLTLQGPAGADDWMVTSYTAAAQANGSRMTLTVPNAPGTSTPIDSGGPTAEATLSSVRGNRAFAALPYPGSAFLAGPGLVAGALGSSGVALPATAPPYPFAVEAQGGQEQALSNGPYAIQAKTTDNTATSRASIGSAGTDGAASVLNGASLATAEKSDDTLVATAESTFRGVGVGPLSIAAVRSTAHVERKPGEALRRSTALEFQGVTVGGTPLEVGTNEAPKGLEALNDALKSSGIKVEIAPARETDNGVTAAVLRIQTPVPQSPSTGQGFMSLEFGGVQASIDAIDASTPDLDFTFDSEAPAETTAGGELTATLPGASTAEAIGSPATFPSAAAGTLTTSPDLSAVSYGSTPGETNVSLPAATAATGDTSAADTPGMALTTTGTTPDQAARVATPIAAHGRFDTHSAYVAVAAAGLLGFLFVGRLIKGVAVRWIS